MSITKLKTLGSWSPRRVAHATDGPRAIRGRIITGLLTGEGELADEPADEHAATCEPRAPHLP